MSAAYWKARVLAAHADPAALEALALELAGLLGRPAEVAGESVSPATFVVPPDMAGFGCDTGDETVRVVRPGAVENRQAWAVFREMAGAYAAAHRKKRERSGGGETAADA